MAEYIFKYNDGFVFQAGKPYITLEKFTEININFPIVKGAYFEYGKKTDGSDRIDLINSEGHHFPQDLERLKFEYKELIDAIKNLT